jgi:hypothetical protein
MDSTTSCKLLSFLDAYSGYHQISLAIDEEVKTTFITPFGIFYYTKMAFRIKNGGRAYIISAYASSWKLRLGGTLEPTLMT